MKLQNCELVGRVGNQMKNRLTKKKDLLSEWQMIRFPISL